MFIDLSRRLCSVCSDRKHTKGGSMARGKFVCHSCRPTMEPPKKKIQSPEDQARRRKEKKDEARAEAVKMQEKKLSVLDEERKKALELEEKKDQRYQRVLNSVIEKLNGDDYKAWYEATTCENVSDFIEKIMNPMSFVVGEFGSGWRHKLLERVEIYVNSVAYRNPWTNPENKALLCEEVRATRDPAERRRIMVRLATPRWSNQNAVVAIYRERDRLAAETGIPHEVDHIVPIVSRVVCGLHCENNLRAIPMFENRSKSNKYEIA